MKPWMIVLTLLVLISFTAVLSIVGWARKRKK
jgi:hypothetical protein